MKRLAAARGGVGLTPATAWRSGTRRTLCRCGTIVLRDAVIAVVCLMLNLQPEAGSEEFVRSSSVEGGTRSAACGCFVRVGVDVSATIADSAVQYRARKVGKRHNSQACRERL